MKLADDYNTVNENEMQENLSNNVAKAISRFEALLDATGKLALEKDIKKEYGALSKALSGLEIILNKIDKKVK